MVPLLLLYSFYPLSLSLAASPPPSSQSDAPQSRCILLPSAPWPNGPFCAVALLQELRTGRGIFGTGGLFSSPKIYPAGSPTDASAVAGPRLYDPTLYGSVAEGELELREIDMGWTWSCSQFMARSSVPRNQGSPLAGGQVADLIGQRTMRGRPGEAGSLKFSGGQPS